MLNWVKEIEATFKNLIKKLLSSITSAMTNSVDAMQACRQQVGARFRFDSSIHSVLSEVKSKLDQQAHH